MAHLLRLLQHVSGSHSRLSPRRHVADDVGESTISVIASTSATAVVLCLASDPAATATRPTLPRHASSTTTLGNESSCGLILAEMIFYF